MTDQIATYNRVLAEAAKECPKCDGLCAEMRKPPDASQGQPNGIPCRCMAFEDGCQGSGHVARFPGFRQECACSPSCKRGRGYLGYEWDKFLGQNEPHPQYKLCSVCSGSGWQVHAGGLESALAGLTLAEYYRVVTKLGNVKDFTYPELRTDPMPSAPEILAEGLRLVIEITRLGATHQSDCATHNMPAYPNESCDCRQEN